MKKTARIAISALAAAFVLLTGVLLSPAAQADPPRQDMRTRQT